MTALPSRWLNGLPAGFARNLSWQYVASLTAVGLGFLYSIVVARGVGVHDFGLLSLALSFAAIVFQVVELRLQEAVIRFVAEFWEKRDAPRTLATIKLFAVADATTGVLAFSLVMAAAPWAEAHLLTDGRSHTALLLAALGVLFANVGTATASGIYRVFGEFRTQAMVSCGGAVLKFIGALLAIFILKWDVIGVLLMGAATSFVTNAVLILLAARLLERRIPLRSTHAPLSLLVPHTAELRRFVTNTYLLSLTMVPTKDLDVNVLGLFVPLQVIGVYKLAKSFMSAVWTISDPIFLVIYPELARLWTRKAYGEIRIFLRRIALIAGSSGVILYLAACLIVPFVIVRLMGPSFAAAGPLFCWMTWGLCFWAPLVWLNPLMMAAGRPDLLLRASILAGIITALLYAVAVPLGGATAAATVSSFANPLVLAIGLRMAFRYRIFQTLSSNAEIVNI